MSYVLDTILAIKMPRSAKNPVIRELLSNYTYGREWNVQKIYGNNIISVGNFEKADIGNSEFVINITDNGIYIEGADYSSLMRGFVTFLEKIKYNLDKDHFYMEKGCFFGNPDIKFRSVHFCVFPETKLDFLKKCVRTSAVARYSHIILEFWGMLKFDCMKELAWPFAYSKEEIKNIVAEANSLGVEIIPMFNHLGHASGCRGINGKHVVLDQNIKYEYMFESFGWVWNFKREDVRKLLRNVRDELMEVCGKGSYFHIGCDEAFSYGKEEAQASALSEYLNEVSRELEAKGRKCIIWHDMLISETEFKDYIATSTPEVSEILLKNLDRNIIVADWQYSCKGETWKTSLKFKDEGFDVVCCPWYVAENAKEAIETVKSNKLLGIIHTTWHKLYCGFQAVVYSGLKSYGDCDEETLSACDYYAAAIARKVIPSSGDYEKCGWSEQMTGPGL